MKIVSWIIELFRDPLRHETERLERIRDQIFKLNYFKLKNGSLIMLAFSIFILVVDFTVSDKIWSKGQTKMFLVLDIAFAVVSVLTVFFTRIYSIKNLFLQRLVFHFAITALVFWSATITGIEFASSASFVTFFLILLIISFNLYLRFWRSFGLYLMVVVIFLGNLYLQGEFNRIIIQSFFPIFPSLLFAFIVSRQAYQNKIKELLNQETILEMNEELKTAKTNLKKEVDRQTQELLQSNQLLKKEKEKAESKEERYRFITQNINELIVVSEPNGHINFVTGNSKRLLGIPKKELKHANVEQLLNKINLDANKKEEISNKYHLALSNKHNHVEYDFSLKIGEEVKHFFGQEKLVYDANGQHIESISVFRDVTERIRSIELQNKVMLAQKSAEMKQSFLANISHEMRTPMNGIIGMTEFLSETKLDKNQQEYVETIQNSSESLLGIINDVLNLSKIEQGKVASISELTDVKRLIKSVLDIFKPQALKKGIELKHYIDNQFPPYLFIDKHNFKQILFNLVSNALKYTQQGKVYLSITVEEQKDDHLKGKVIVKDTGIGIKPNNLGKIFDPFTRIEDKYTQITEGTGLGLAITKKLVKLLDGEIGCESQVNIGSTFWFTFNAQHSSADKIEQEKSEKSIDNLNLHILLAEDKKLNQKVAQKILENLGCTIEIANNGQETLDIYKENKFDIILLDIMMPVMNGIEAMKELKEKYSTLPPIIGLSAHALEGDAERFMDMGMDDYLEKPINKNKLAEKLIKWGVSSSLSNHSSSSLDNHSSAVADNNTPPN
jgi:PAS domain S-box-containing protein